MQCSANVPQPTMPTIRPALLDAALQSVNRCGMKICTAPRVQPQRPAQSASWCAAIRRITIRHVPDNHFRHVEAACGRVQSAEAMPSNVSKASRTKSMNTAAFLVGVRPACTA